MDYPDFRVHHGLELTREANVNAKALIHIQHDAVDMEGMLELPHEALGIVLFAHGSGSSRLSPRNNYVARILREAGIGTLLLDLLSEDEEADPHHRFDIALLTLRLRSAARWLARELRRPLLTLDLSAVMSSFLGRTGANVRHVLDYAKSVTGVLLLDELDAIAKRRDDTTDVGELKRLVTVLLQEIDDWPPTGLLIAATNHADLLDPAVWRRFEMQVEFPLPTEASVHKAIETFLGTSKAPEVWNNVLAVTLRGLSYSDIERELMLARRASVTRSIPLEDALSEVVQNRVDPLPRKERGQIALWLTEAGISQRQVHELTRVSRDTIRKKTRSRHSGGHKGD